MFPRYNSSSQGHTSPSCSWKVGRVRSVITDIWDVSHSPQKSPTHISGHTSLRTARRLSICVLDSASIFLGQSKRNRPVTVSAEGNTVTHRQRFSFSTSPHLKSFAHLYGAFHGSQTDLQQERQADSTHSQCIGISQSGSLWVCWWLNWKERLILDSFHPMLEIKGNTTSPWLHRVWMQYREL